jgi:hypothetical protein
LEVDAIKWITTKDVADRLTINVETGCVLVLYVPSALVAKVGIA